MILADTSVWVDHLRGRDAAVAGLLEAGRILCHAFVRGELACGSLPRRAEILSLLAHLPQAPVATDAEVLTLIERHALAGTGIGYIDAHLLAGTMLAGARLWTSDRRLATAAQALGLAALLPG